MPRPPRIQFAGANYHIVTRGDGRRSLFHDTGHYERFTRGLEDEVQRSGWIVLAYCWMPNHIHALIQTPEPNLARGMQHWLSGYANWYAKRNRRTGHLYQGRYKDFLRLMIALGEGGSRHRHESTSRRLRSVSVAEILAATASRHGVQARQYKAFHSQAAGRDMAAWLCRRWTGATLAQLGPSFGLPGTDSVSNLVRRAERRHKQSASWQKAARQIEATLGLNTAIPLDPMTPWTPHLRWWRCHFRVNPLLVYLAPNSSSAGFQAKEKMRGPSCRDIACLGNLTRTRGSLS